MKKVAINDGVGSFGLSAKAQKRIEELDSKLNESLLGVSIYSDEFRRNTHLIQAIEELGDEANTAYSTIAIVEIPDDVDYVIEMDDGGIEHVAEAHRTWWGPKEG